MAASYPPVSATHCAPSNIAVIKYWGKRDVVMNTPINSSVSMTMSQDDLRAITTIVASPEFTEDRLWLNGIEEPISKSKRVQVVLKEIRARAGNKTVKLEDGSEVIVPAEVLSTWKVHIVSRNTFPTAAGLASSAAGYACLVHTLADVFAVEEKFPGELTTIARQGSGSACRSLYGGFVQWSMGTKEDSLDSMGVQIATEDHWDDICLLIAVVSDAKKETGSTDGMVRSVNTSALLKYRAETVVDERLDRIKKAYLEKDFATFAEISMQDSNQFHACCMDTFPPIFYMNDVSKRIISILHKINAEAGRTIVGYTFDAGPNAVIITTKEHAAYVFSVLLAHFPTEETAETYFTGSSFPGLFDAAVKNISNLPAALACDPAQAAPGKVKHVYATTVGDGPRVLPPAEALADLKTGLPLVVGAADGVACDKGL